MGLNIRPQWGCELYQKYSVYRITIVYRLASVEDKYFNYVPYYPQQFTYLTAFFTANYTGLYSTNYLTFLCPYRCNDFYLYVVKYAVHLC